MTLSLPYPGFLERLMHSLLGCFGSAPRVSLPPPPAPPAPVPEQTATSIAPADAVGTKKKAKLTLRNDRIATDLSLPSADGQEYV